MSQQPAYRMPLRTLVIATVMGFSMWAPLFVVPPMANILVQDLALTPVQTSVLFSGPVLMLCLAALPAGNLADRFGIKKVAGTGSLAIVVGTAMRGFSHDFTLLLIATMIYGLGIGWTFPNLPKLVRSCAPREHTLLYIGILVAGVLVSGSIALAATLPLIYPLTNSYEGVFLFWAGPTLIASVLWWSLLEDPPCRPPLAPLSGKVATRSGVLAVLGNPKVLLIAGTFLLHNFFLYTWTGILPAYLVQQGFSPDVSGVITSLMFWAAIPAVILVPLWSLRVDVQRRLFVWIPSLILLFASWAVMTSSGLWTWLLMLLVGIATALRFITILIMPAEMLPPEQAGTASGVNISIAYIGALVGPVIAGSILNANGSYAVIYWLLLAVSSVTAILGLVLPPVSSRKQWQ